MFTPYGSLLSTAVRMLPLLRPPAAVLVPDFSTAFGFGKGQFHQQHSIVIPGIYANVRPALNYETLQNTVKYCEMLPHTEEPVLKNIKPSAPARILKSRLSRAIKARARLRQQHRTRSHFVARNK